MKSTIRILTSITGIAIFISSCTMQKRLYTKGYYIESTSDISSKSMPVITNTNVASAQQIISLKKEICLVGNEITPVNQIVFKKYFFKANQVVSKSNLKLSPVTNMKSVGSVEVAQDKTNIVLDNNTDGEKTGGSLALRITGWVIYGIGFIMIFTVSWLLGLIIAFIGIGLVLAGRKKKKESNSDQNSGQMQDVIYLKNGSIVRGTIIETVPNVSIKLQTNDGNVFVYKMEEIDKMAKEKSK
jgi:hypothetical protein